MAGQRIDREKKTIRSMISLYQRRCPDAQADVEHYQALNAYADSGWINACLAKRSRPVSSARFTATSRQNAKK